MLPVLTPPVWLNTTASPPVVRVLPAPSLAVKVSVTLLPEATELDERVIVDWATEIVPGVTLAVGFVVVIGAPPMVAPMLVAVPARTPVSVAV